MRALVMAAGLGTRLRPLTDNLPKPLVLVQGVPMVEYVLTHLEKNGVTEALINIHYLPEKMRAFAREWNGAGRLPRLELQDESQEILGSGGAVAKAAPWLFAQQSAALVCNADVIASPDVRALLLAHQRLEKDAGVLATLAVMTHPEAGRKYTGLRVQKERVTAFESKGIGGLHFPGFYIVSKAAMARLPPAGESFSVMDALWKPLAQEGLLGAWTYAGSYLDLGTPEDLSNAEIFLGGGER